MLPITNMFIQLRICFICVTLGASEGLNCFDCFIIEDGRGGHELKFVLKEGVPEVIGVLHAAGIACD